MGKTQLYRAYSHEGVLLYIGISLSVFARLSGHSKTANWFSSLAHIKVQHFATRRGAMEAEKKAISTERPLYNVQHSREKRKEATLHTVPPEEFSYAAEELIRTLLRKTRWKRRKQANDSEYYVRLTGSEFSYDPILEC